VETGGNGKESGCHDRHDHVDHKPVALESRHQSLYLDIEQAYRGEEGDEREPGDKGRHITNVSDPERDQVDGQNHQRARDCKLIHVCPWHALSRNPAQEYPNT